MDDPSHVEVLTRGVSAWNEWRKQKPRNMLGFVASAFGGKPRTIPWWPEPDKPVQRYSDRRDREVRSKMGTSDALDKSSLVGSDPIEVWRYWPEKFNAALEGWMV